MAARGHRRLDPRGPSLLHDAHGRRADGPPGHDRWGCRAGRPGGRGARGGTTSRGLARAPRGGCRPSSRASPGRSAGRLLRARGAGQLRRLPHGAGGAGAAAQPAGRDRGVEGGRVSDGTAVALRSPRSARPRTDPPSPSAPRLGLRANLPQFALLVGVNALVGGMVGQERTLLPLIARDVFGLSTFTSTMTFLVAFGATKAVTNAVAGSLADRFGRRPVLLGGWAAGLPVPLLIIWAPSWSWVVFANVLLGVNQGLCWSTTVIMKIDLVGPARRGLAMGVNEFAGYVAVSLSALVTGYLAAAHGLRPTPFYPGIAFALLGLALSVFAVRETQGHARVEARQLGQAAAQPRFAQILLLTTWHDRTLFAASQAGMGNNMNDGMVWGLIPVFLAARGVALDRIGVVTATYPLVWGVGQLATGALSDRWGRKWMIASGMWVQRSEERRVGKESRYRW